MIETVLSNNQQTILREKNVITSEEVAFQVGDLYIAENIISKERRRLDENLVNIDSVNEKVSTTTTNTRTLLKG
jgi:hypothetical protein